MRVFTSVILFAVIGIDKGDSFLSGKSAVKKNIRSTSTVRAASSTGTIITNASTIPTWEDLAERNQGDEGTPLLTFFRDTNGWCPFCERVWICLRAKNIPYEEQLISLFQKPDWYKAMVPTTQVPAILFHDDKINNDKKTQRSLVWESKDIMQALDDKFPDTPKLVLSTKAYKAASEQMGDLNTVGFAFLGYARNKSDNETSEEEKALILHEKKQEFLKALDELDVSILETGGPFRLGSEFTGVDAEMIPTLERWRYQLPLFHEIDIMEGREGIKRWFEAMDNYKPYSDRVMGDRYSWTATSVVFARYFAGTEIDAHTEAYIARSEDAASALIAKFGDFGDIDVKEEFVLEAGQKLISNHEAIIADCTNKDPKSQQTMKRAKDPEVANKTLLFTANLLLEAGENIIDVVNEASVDPLEFDTKAKEDAAVALKTIASRLCVPRDMSAPAAGILRYCLMSLSEKIESS